jgi:hypothetical protein
MATAVPAGRTLSFQHAEEISYLLNALIPILKAYNEENGDPDNTKVVEYLPPKRLLEAANFLVFYI